MLRDFAPKTTFLLASELSTTFFLLNFVYAFQVIVVFFTVITSSIIFNQFGGGFFVYSKRFLT